MKFYKKMYIGENVNNIFATKQKLKMHAGVDVYVIALSRGMDQLEIYHASYLKQRYYRKHPPVIIGIASDHAEAVRLVIKITEECLEQMGNCDLKEYLKYKVKSENIENGVLL